jgi:hypothetical protein
VSGRQGRPGEGPTRPDPVLAGAVASGTLAVGGMWLPWFRSGSAPRNSFGLFRAAQVLGIEWITPFRVAWFLLPVVLLVAVALIGFRATRSGALLLAALGLILALAGILSVDAFGSAGGSAGSAGAGMCCMVLGAVGLRRNVATGAGRG